MNLYELLTDENREKYNIEIFCAWIEHEAYEDYQAAFEAAIRKNELKKVITLVELDKVNNLNSGIKLARELKREEILRYLESRRGYCNVV